MFPTDRNRTPHGQSPRVSDQQLVSAFRSGRLSPRPAAPNYLPELLQRIRRLQKQQAKARMSENIRRETFLMSNSCGLQSGVV